MKRKLFARIPNGRKEKAGETAWEKFGLSVMAAVLGAVCFAAIYDIRILNPAYDAWLLQGGDLTSHYIGWEFFRASQWQFPIGLMDRICYPNTVSIIFTDSIPVFAVLFKLLSPLLPETFQYFGWWGLLCFILQGVFSANLLFLCLGEKGRGADFQLEVFSLAGSLFFVMSPVLLMKMFMHTALASHWLLTASFYFAKKYIEFPEKWNGDLVKKQLVIWGVLGILCGTIHMYYVPLCGIILGGFLIARVVKDRKIMPSFYICAAFSVGALGMVLLLGGLSHDHQWDAGGLGQFSFNMNGFFNSMGWSRWLPGLSAYGEGYGEGFSYLGLGVLALLLVGAAGGICHSRGSGKRLFIHADVWSYTFIVIICVLLSASHKFALNGKIVFDIPYPEKIISLWGTFRSSGRFIWPVIYLVILWAMVLIGKWVGGNKLGIVLLALAFVLQSYDISRLLEAKRNLTQQENVNNIIQDEKWGQIAEGKEHIIFVSRIVQNQDILFNLCQFAYYHNLTVNDFYFAHSAEAGDIEKSREESMEELREDTLYIFKEQDKELCEQYELEYFMLDGIIVGVVG